VLPKKTAPANVPSSAHRRSKTDGTGASLMVMPGSALQKNPDFSQMKMRLENFE